VDRQGFAHVEGGAGKQLAGKGNRHGKPADAGVGLVHLGKLGGEAVELLTQLGFGGGQQAPDLVAPLGRAFTQRPQITLGKSLHEFFNLVMAQVAGQQGNALALLLVVPGGWGPAFCGGRIFSSACATCHTPRSST